MSIFSRCCPKKPKKSLDYIIKWVEETDKTLKEVVAWKEQIEEDDLKTLFDTYAESYPWDQVPVIGTLQEDVSDLQHDLRSLETNVSSLETDVDSRLAARIEKPAEYVAGNVPVWTENAGLSGEGRAIEENAPSADSAGLITSGAVYAALQGKANLEHYHNIIINQASGGRLAEFEVDATSRTATLGLNDGTTYKSAEINMNNIDNLNRALQSPQVPTQGSNKYSTSGQIYDFVKAMSPKELTLEYGAKVINKWELLGVSDNQEFFNLMPYNTPVSIKFKCNKPAGQASDVSQHNFYVYGSLQINLEGQEDELTAYIYINNAVYQCFLGRLDGQEWVYLDTTTLTKLQEDPFF